MSWFGKLIGGSWGFVFGGPIGAIIGGSIGHFLIDRNISTRTERGIPHHAGSYETEQIQVAYFVSVFSIFAKIAQADGIVSREERALVEQFAVKMGLQQEQRDFAMKIFEEAQAKSYSVRDLARQFASIIGGRRDLANSFMDMLFRIASADGVVHPREIEAIRIVFEELPINISEFESIRKRHVDATEDWYQKLGCSPDDSDEAIKTAYRKLANDYHPDRIISRGLPNEFVALATERFQEIQHAYESIKRHRGMK